MNEKILFNCETFIEEMQKEELLSSIKDYFEELGYFNDINTDDEMNKFLANKYNIVFDDNEVNEDSLKAVVIEILYSNNKKDNEILFNSINFDNDDEVDDISEEEDFDEDDDE